MGYAGATYLVQEVCNALFDALFHILPLAPTWTGSRRRRRGSADEQLAWDDDASAASTRRSRPSRCWCGSRRPSACATRRARRAAGRRRAGHGGAARGVARRARRGEGRMNGSVVVRATRRARRRQHGGSGGQGHADAQQAGDRGTFGVAGEAIESRLIFAASFADVPAAAIVARLAPSGGGQAPGAGSRSSPRRGRRRTPASRSPSWAVSRWRFDRARSARTVPGGGASAVTATPRQPSSPSARDGAASLGRKALNHGGTQWSIRQLRIGPTRATSRSRV